jgi:hypothetical protein
MFHVKELLLVGMRTLVCDVFSSGLKRISVCLLTLASPTSLIKIFGSWVLLPFACLLHWAGFDYAQCRFWHIRQLHHFIAWHRNRLGWFSLCLSPIYATNHANHVILRCCQHHEFAAHSVLAAPHIETLSLITIAILPLPFADLAIDFGAFRRS